ncbi:MAG: ABC transporter permease [Spirochaetes bacterium]|nr:ABC transporter permease [Spirochaetota bacterium]
MMWLELIKTESLKLKRSMVPWFSWLAFSMAPLAVGFLMLILKDPEGAKKLGLIAMKAQMTGGSADWPFLFYITQVLFVAGAILHAVIIAYIFGREYAEGTAKNLLTLPVRRPLVVIAKYLVSSMLFCVICFLVFWECMVVGHLVSIPGWDIVLLNGTMMNVTLSVLLILAAGPFVALIAMVGKGYIAPIAYSMITTLFFGQLFGHTLWGRFIPWSMLFVHAGVGGPGSPDVGPVSYAIAGVFFVSGLFACGAYLNGADNHQ